MSDKSIKITENGESVVFDNGSTVFTVDSGQLFGMIFDLFVITECHPILLSAVDIAKDDCSKKK